MALDKPGIIDQVGIHDTADAVILTILDNEDWSNIDQHLERLQNKLNTYLDFATGGSLLKQYPEAKEKRIIVEVLGSHVLPEEGLSFFNQAKEVISQLNIHLSFKLNTNEEE